jgi:hypothetical protein
VGGVNIEFDDDAIFAVVKDVIDNLYEEYSGCPLDEVTKACQAAGLESPEIAEAISRESSRTSRPSPKPLQAPNRPPNHARTPKAREADQAFCKLH